MFVQIEEVFVEAASQEGESFVPASDTVTVKGICGTCHCAKTYCQGISLPPAVTAHMNLSLI